MGRVERTGKFTDNKMFLNLRYQARSILRKKLANLLTYRYFSGHSDCLGTRIMLNELAAGVQVYLVTGYTDLRKSIDGLAVIVQGQLNIDPYSFFLSI